MRLAAAAAAAAMGSPFADSTVSPTGASLRSGLEPGRRASVRGLGALGDLGALADLDGASPRTRGSVSIANRPNSQSQGRGLGCVMRARRESSLRAALGLSFRSRATRPLVLTLALRSRARVRARGHDLRRAGHCFGRWGRCLMAPVTRSRPSEEGSRARNRICSGRGPNAGGLPSAPDRVKSRRASHISTDSEGLLGPRASWSREDVVRTPSRTQPRALSFRGARGSRAPRRAFFCFFLFGQFSLCSPSRETDHRADSGPPCSRLSLCPAQFGIHICCASQALLGQGGGLISECPELRGLSRQPRRREHFPDEAQARRLRQQAPVHILRRICQQHLEGEPASLAAEADVLIKSPCVLRRPHV